MTAVQLADGGGRLPLLSHAHLDHSGVLQRSCTDVTRSRTGVPAVLAGRSC